MDKKIFRKNNLSRWVSLVLSASIFVSLSGISLFTLPVPQAQATGAEVIKITVDATEHNDYGLSYPGTYEFSIPAAAVGLKAYKKYNLGDAWTQMTEKTTADYFNGIEAVRFDYAGDKVYISVAFSATSDTIYLEVTDTDDTGTLQDINYLGMANFYDNRDAAVVVTADDWTGAVGRDDVFATACTVFRNANMWITPSIITNSDGVPPNWASIQTQIDAGYVEPASHSRNHNNPYPPVSYDEETEGSRDDILNNLDMPALNKKGALEYVYAWIEPGGLSDATYRAKLGQYKYLSDRSTSTPSHDYATWDETNGTYNRALTSTWGEPGNFNLGDANTRLDSAIALHYVYHLWFHPNDADFSDGSTLRQHIDYIKNKTNVWYVGFGQLYLYHYYERLASLDKIQVGPALSSWDLNMDAGTMTLHFGQAMDDTVNVDETKFKIQDAVTLTTSYTLTTSASVWTDTTTLTVTFSGADLAAIVADPGIAISANDSYLHIATGTGLVDAAGKAFSLDAVTDNTIKTDNYTPDSTRASLASWDLNMNESTMTLHFDMAMDQAVDPDETKFTIQDAVTATTSYTLTDSVSAWSDATTLLVTLSYTDFTAIEATVGLATSAANSYLLIAADSGLVDNATTQLLIIYNGDGSAIVTQVDAFVATGTPVPSSQYIDLDGNGTVDRIRWTFGENVTACAYNLGDWSVQTAGTVNVAITGLSCTTTDHILDILVTATAWTTGGTTDPVISYTNNANRVTLTSGNMGRKPYIIASDGAAPFARSASYGIVTGGASDHVSSIIIVMTADTGNTCNGDISDWTFHAGTVNITGVSDCTLTGVNSIRLTVTGTLANTTGGADSPTVTYTDDPLKLDTEKPADAAGNIVVPFGPMTVTDALRPAPVSALYKDANNDGAIDRIDITMTADVGLACTFEAGDWSIPEAGTINANTLAGPCVVTGNDIQLSVSANAGITGGALDPTIKYSNLAPTLGSVKDALNNRTATFATDLAVLDGAAPLLIAVDLSKPGDYNVLTFTYSENVTVADGSSGVTSADITTAGTVEGFGSFATPGDVTATSAKNTLAGSGTSIITITLADQAGGNLVTVVDPGTEPSGNFTPVAAAAVVDEATTPLQVNIAAALVAAAGGGWDLTQPTITAVAEFDVNADGKIDEVILTFSEPIVDANVTVANFTIGGTAANTVMATTSTNGTDTNIANDNIITIKVAAGVTGTEPKAVVYTAGTLTDTAHNLLATVTIAAGAVTDSAAPIIITTSPASAATSVALGAPVVVTFSEPMNIGTVTRTSAPDPGGWAVGWTGGNSIATYNHTNFYNNYTYTLRITAGQDVAGNALVAGPVANPWTFAAPFVSSGGVLLPSVAPAPAAPAAMPPSQNTSVITLILHDPEPAAALPAGVSVGTLVKRADISAVYFIDQDNRRHSFPNDKVYFSYFPDFSGVQTISAATLAAIPLGSNVTVRPGTLLVKVQSDPKVYAVEPYGVLRWISTEQIATDLYGANWSNRIIDIDPTFFINYQVGSNIITLTHPSGSVIQYAGSTNRYYINSGQKELITPDVFNSNHFQDKFVGTNIAASISYPLASPMPKINMETLVTLR